MLQLIQPLISALIGFLLAVFGLVHTVRSYPGGRVFARLWQALPSVGAVCLFLVGVLAVVAGLTLLYYGVRRTRRRWRFLHRVMDRPMQKIDDDQWEPGYQYG